MLVCCSLLTTSASDSNVTTSFDSSHLLFRYDLNLESVSSFTAVTPELKSRAMRDSSHFGSTQIYKLTRETISLNIILLETSCFARAATSLTYWSYHRRKTVLPCSLDMIGKVLKMNYYGEAIGYINKDRTKKPYTIVITVAFCRRNVWDRTLCWNLPVPFYHIFLGTWLLII